MDSGYASRQEMQFMSFTLTRMLPRYGRFDERTCCSLIRIPPLPEELLFNWWSTPSQLFDEEL
jgi:hypothetical protein